MNPISPKRPAPHSHHGINRREFFRVTATAGTGIAVARLPAAGALFPATPSGPGAIRFAIIGDYGETMADQAFPLDTVAAMIRSWNPDFVVSTGDNNYVLGEAATIDINVGKNFTGYIYPKTTEIPVQYPYPSGAPLFNRFIPCLGNHDYSDVADSALPSTKNIPYSNPYLQYFRNALRTGTSLAPNTTITFADQAVGQTWTRGLISGKVEDYQSFSETENLRFYDVRLGTATGPSSVHLFILDSDSPTPYGRHSADRPIPNHDGSNSAFTEIATQAAWLRKRLAASTARWKIVILHHPPYNSAPGAETTQYTFARWPFRAWGASAVIAGHVHNYERLEMPDPNADLEPDYGSPTIPYIVNGAGGFIPEQGFDPSFVVKGSLVRVAEYGAQLVTADENSLNFLYYDLHGVLRDVKTIYADDQQGPPQVEFAGREFPVEANAGTVTITVTRLGDTRQPVSVNYATADGTAIAGENYTAASGVLSFKAGETTQSIAISILPPPVFGATTVPWESLIFSVVLSLPNVGSLGFFNIATVILVNTVDTPMTNQHLFILQTYQDLFLRPPSDSEITAAKLAIGSFDAWIERARWVYDLVTGAQATEPVFPAVQVYSVLQLSDLSALGGQAAPPSFPDLQDGVNLYRTAQTPEEGLIALSEAFNQNALALLDGKIPGFATDNSLFIDAIYKGIILPLDQDLTPEDKSYWLSQLSTASDAERQRSRNLMLGRIATQSFNTPPVAGMTPFDLTSKNGNEVLLGILLAGLLRVQLSYREFLLGYLIPARVGGGIVIGDDIFNMIQSASYAARFRITSFEGYIDSVKANLPAPDRLPDADPENDGRTNLEEYSFALVPGHERQQALTELEVVDQAGQRFGIFSYRSANYIKRVEFLIQVSTDLKTWTAVGDPGSDGGEDEGTYIRRRIRIPIESSATRQFFRVRVRQIP